MKFLISFISLILSGTVFANTTWTQKAVLIERGTELHKMIDEITLEIFQSALRPDLCTVFSNPTSAYYSLGVSEKTALDLFKGCKPVAAPMTKVMPKSYYISFASEPLLDSWTDYGNRTYIFANENLTRSHLKSIILHEIAMLTDAKTNLLYTGYLSIRDANKTSKTQNTNLSVVLNNLSKTERTLQTAFSMARWSPMSQTFSTLRAFQVELMSEGMAFNFKDHNVCSRLVRETFDKIKRLPEPPKSEEVDSIIELLAAPSTQNTPKTIQQQQELLNFLLSPDLILKDNRNKKVTFCQFMTDPILTNNSFYTFFSSGPRPRLTGGSGGQGKDDSDKSSMSVSEVMKHLTPRQDSRWQNQKLRENIEKLKSQQRLQLKK